jgi:hypothetical protein
MEIKKLFEGDFTSDRWAGGSRKTVKWENKDNEAAFDQELT